MDDKLKKILSDSKAQAGEGKLLDYINNNLTAEEQHELELQMNDDEFMSDAFDGLQELKDTGDLPGMVHQLNSGLKKQLRNKNKNRQKYFKEGPWIYFSIVLLLILAVVAFVVIRKFLEG